MDKVFGGLTLEVEQSSLPWKQVNSYLRQLICVPTCTHNLSIIQVEINMVVFKYLTNSVLSPRDEANNDGVMASFITQSGEGPCFYNMILGSGKVNFLSWKFIKLHDNV